MGKKTIVRLNIGNLLDKKYFVSERDTLYIAPARTFGLSVNAEAGTPAGRRP